MEFDIELVSLNKLKIEIGTFNDGKITMNNKVYQTPTEIEEDYPRNTIRCREGEKKERIENNLILADNGYRPSFRNTKKDAKITNVYLHGEIYRKLLKVKQEYRIDSLSKTIRKVIEVGINQLLN